MPDGNFNLMAGLYKTRGIVIRQMKYGESSLILDLFTEEKGLRSFIVGAVRSKKSKAALYQIMNCIEVVAYDKNADKLNRIKEANLSLIYQNLPINIYKSTIGLFLMDVFRCSVKERETNRPLFDFLYNWLTYLDQTELSLAYLPCLFMLELSEQLGFQPQANFDSVHNRFQLLDGAFVESTLEMQYLLSEKDSLNLSLLQKTRKEMGFDHLEMNKIERSDLLDQIINFFKIHQEGFKELKSLDIIKTVLN